MQNPMPQDRRSELLPAKVRYLKDKQPVGLSTAARWQLSGHLETESPRTGRIENSKRESQLANCHHIKPNNPKYAHRARLDHNSINVRFGILTNSIGPSKKTTSSQPPAQTTMEIVIPAILFAKNQTMDKIDHEERANKFSAEEFNESKLVELRHSILQRIKHKLMNNPFFSLREFDNDKANPQTSNLEPQRKPKSQIFTTRESVHESSSLVTEMIFSSDHHSAIQQLLGVPNFTQSDIAVHECVRIICQTNKTNNLFESRQGNELMQELVQHNEAFCLHLIDFCYKNLRSLINDELKTKTLYVIAKQSAQFRIRLFKWFSENFETTLSSTAAVFLLISAFKVSESAEEFRPISRIVFSQELSPDTRVHKNFKRFMITYCEFCREEELDQVSQLLQAKKRIFAWLGDKYEALILSSFIRRKQPEIYKKFLHLLRFNLKDLFRTKFFKSLFFRLSRSPTPAKVVGELNATLLGIPEEQYCEIQRSNSEFLFYVAMAVMTASLHQGPLLAAVAASIESPDGLMRVFDHLPVPQHNIIR